MGRIVSGDAAVPTTAHVTLSMAPVSVIQGGSALTAHNVRELNERINRKLGTC